MEVVVREEPAKKPSWIFILVMTVPVIVLLFGFGTIALYVGPKGILLAKRAKLQNEMAQVQTAVLSYDTEYSVYPVASDNATLIKLLTTASAQGNTRGITFVSFRAADLDAKGELLDPWGMPIQLSVTADGTFRARSAGPDKTFGTADDIPYDDGGFGIK